MTAAASSELMAALAVQSVPGIGAAYAKRLVDAAGSFCAVIDQGPELAEKAGVPRPYAERIKTHKDKALARAEAHVDSARRIGARVVALTDPGYPPRLREIHDPPAALYIYGEALPEDELSIAIVGTRKASESGMTFARQLGNELASAGITVISGLALGIDAAAHRGALEADGGRTIAVLGTGIDICYPQKNKNLYDRIRQDGRGAVMSEFSPGTGPEPYQFPMRNRIVSGMSLGVVVVEAPERSGALITARLAAEQGRDVFAVPHSARSVAGAGSNRLIREGAHLVEGVEDILSVIEREARELRAKGIKSRASAPTASLSPAPVVSEIYDLLSHGVSGLDELVDKSGKPTASVLSELTRLEIEGRVRRTAACTYQAVRRA